jgi:hypothetical protein
MTYRHEGTAVAIGKFAASIGVHDDRLGSNVGLPQAGAQVAEGKWSFPAIMPAS